jgi:hypothetical protein
MSSLNNKELIMEATQIVGSMFKYNDDQVVQGITETTGKKQKNRRKKQKRIEKKVMREIL